MQKTIFVVDDSALNLSLVEKALEEHYQVITMSSAAKMFKLLGRITPELILLDIKMPHMDGFEALRRLKSSELHAAIPVIFLTGISSPSTEVEGLEMGAVDFITKPFVVRVLQNRVKTQLDAADLIRERTTQLENLQNDLVFTLSDIVESRDSATGGHIMRTSAYVKILTDAMINRGVYAAEIRAQNSAALISSARLHDIGKISIPDAILNKLGSLTKEEFEMVKAHTLVGEQIIDRIIARTGNAALLHNAKLFAGCHHERWDGSGYPHGLKETEIPIQGRIMAVADVYDALLSDRRYKKNYSENEVCALIADGAGKLFDPQIAEVFFEIQDQVNEARQNHANKGINPVLG